MTLERGTRDTMPFQRLVFHLMILMNWTLTFNSVFSAETENFNLEEQINQKFLDLKLSDSVFDYQVDEPVEPDQNNSNNLIYNFKLNFDVMFKVFEFIFDPNFSENFIKIISLLKVSKSFHYVVQFYMKNVILKTIKCNEISLNSSILPALCIVFGGEKFKIEFSGLKNLKINFKDLIEIGHSANFKNLNYQIITSLNHLSKTIYTNPPFKIPIFEELETWKRYWIKGVIDRVFRFNQLFYSAEMYLSIRILNHETFFNGICEIKENPEILNKFLNRFLLISNLRTSSFQGNFQEIN